MKNVPDIRNEEMLLLELCRLSFSNENITLITGHFKLVTEWDYFTFIANEHGVAALICYNPEKLGLLELLPAKAATFLKNALMLSLSRNAFHTETILEVIMTLDDENIKVVILKGLALELTVYGNSGLRQMTDVYILLFRNDCLHARNILAS